MKFIQVESLEPIFNLSLILINRRAMDQNYQIAQVQTVEKLKVLHL